MKPPRPTDHQILAALDASKSERLIAQELNTNAMRIHRLKKKHSLKTETKLTRRGEILKEEKPVKHYKERTTNHFRFTQNFQYEHFLMDAY